MLKLPKNVPPDGYVWFDYWNRPSISWSLGTHFAFTLSLKTACRKINCPNSIFILITPYDFNFYENNITAYPRTRLFLGEILISISHLNQLGMPLLVSSCGTGN